jgi:hypothetical protein
MSFLLFKIYSFSETEFCPCLQDEPTQLGQIDTSRASLCLRTPETSGIFLFCLYYNILLAIFLVSGDRDQLYLLSPSEYVPPEDWYRIQFPKRRVLNKRQDEG